MLAQGDRLMAIARIIGCEGTRPVPLERHERAPPPRLRPGVGKAACNDVALDRLPGEPRATGKSVDHHLDLPSKGRVALRNLS